ncbi:MAG: hypothetical protein WAK84_11300 [Candidatus Cybelea sp.]
MRLGIAVLLLVTLGVAPASAGDPLSSLRFLVGSWNCTYQMGKASVSYHATYAYDMKDNWISERDVVKGGSNDQGMLTYDPKRGWTAVVIEPERTATIFHATGKNAGHIVYHSVYPDASMSEVFDRVSSTRYTLHFHQKANGKTMTSADTCVKT